MKHIILLVIMILATNAFADTVGDKQLTSRAYVDTTLSTKQDTIPAAGKSGVAAGYTVMTYTPGGNGVIGERGIYSDASNYNAATDADKLITASALNDAFDSLPTADTSTMICANPPTCTLWTIIDQTAYGYAPTSITCATGHYPNSNNECTPCGIGYYCNDGLHRTACTYGTIACSGTTHTFDPPMPAGTSGIYNRALTMAEVNQYIPATDISQWEMIYSGNPSETVYIGCANPSTVNDERLAVLNHELSAGTYLVASIYPYSSATNAVTGNKGTISSAHIVMFDHDVAYRPVHICNSFGNFFDTNNVPYAAANLRLPHNYSTDNENVTNINNVSNILTGYLGAFLYKLK